MPRATLQLRGNLLAGHGLPMKVYISPESTGLFLPGVGEPGLGEEGSPTHGLFIDGDIEVYAELAARPRLGVVQRPGILINIGGTELSLGDMCGTWTVERSIDRPLQTWSFSVPVVNGSSPAPLGDPYTMLAPSPGTDEVNIWGVYQTSAGIRTVKLITDGITDSAPRSGNARSGWTENISGVCIGGRAAQTVTRVFLPGHGLPRGRVVKLLLQDAGFSNFKLEDGSPMVKEIQAVDADPLSLAQEILDAEGRRLMWDVEGHAINPKLGPTGRDATWTFNEQDILAVADVSVSWPGDPITDVTMTGSEQVVRDTEEEPCGTTTKPRVMQISSIYAPLVSDTQDGAGVITTSTQDDPRNMVTTIQINTEERYCGILKRKLSRTYAWYNPQRTRYQWGSGGSINTLLYKAANISPGAVADDQTPAVLHGTEKWSLISETETFYFYDRTGFYGLWVAEYFQSALNNIYWTIANALGENSPEVPQTGRKLGEFTVKRGFYARKWAVKEEQLYDSGEGDPVELHGQVKPWGNTDYIENMDIYADGDGAGVSAGVAPETFQDISGTVTILESNDLNQLLSEHSFTKSWTRPQGNDFWYEGDITSSYENEQYQIVGSELHINSEAGEGFHDESTIRFDGTGRFIDQVDETGIEGALPAVEVIPVGDGADATLYAEGEQDEFAREARDGETRTIKVQVRDDFLEIYHLPKTVKSSLSYAENAEELIAACFLLIDESAAGQVQIVLPANYLLAGLMDKGTPIHVTHRPTGLDHDVRMRSLRWTGGPKTAHLTTVSGVVYGTES